MEDSHTTPGQRRLRRLKPRRLIPLLVAATLTTAGPLAHPATAGGSGDQPPAASATVTVLPVSVEGGGLKLIGRPFDAQGPLSDSTLQRMLEVAKAEQEAKAAPGDAPGAGKAEPPGGGDYPSEILGLLSTRCGPDRTANPGRPMGRVYTDGATQSVDQLLGPPMTDDEFDAMLKQVIDRPIESTVRDLPDTPSHSPVEAVVSFSRTPYQSLAVHEDGSVSVVFRLWRYNGDDDVDIWFLKQPRLPDWDDKPKPGGETSPEAGDGTPPTTPCDPNGQLHWVILVNGISATGDPCNEEVSDPSPAAAKDAAAPPPPLAQIDCGDPKTGGKQPDPSQPPGPPDPSGLGGCDPKTSPCDEKPTGPAPTGSRVSPAALELAQTVLAEEICPPVVCTKDVGRLDPDADFALFRFVLL